MNTIIYNIIVAVAIAFVLGVLLGLFKKIFHVDVDPKVQKVRDVLSGANCGGCGMAGCDAFAGAVVKGDAAADGCVAGGAACATSIAEILGKAGVEVKPKVALSASIYLTDINKYDEWMKEVNYEAMSDDNINKFYYKNLDLYLRYQDKTAFKNLSECPIYETLIILLKRANH